MSKGGWEYATGALAVHDSATVTVVVSLGAGGPGIGRRAARSPRTKNRGIRRARDDARRGAPPRAARTGRYRANQREMPRRATCKLDSGLRSGFALWSTPIAEISRLHRRRYSDARAWHRCKHGGLFRGEWRFVSPAGLPGVKPALPHTSCLVPDVQVLSADPSQSPWISDLAKAMSFF